MAIKHNAAWQADLDIRWKEVREDLLAEYYLVSQAGNEKDNLIRLETDPVSGNSMNFEFYAGVPVISFRMPPGKYGEEPLLSVIGDSMGLTDKVLQPLDEPRHQREGSARYGPLDRVLSDWDSVREKIDGRMKEIRERHYPKERLLQYIYDSLVLDDEPFDRASFYGATKDMSRRELFDMRESLTDNIRRHFEYGVDPLSEKEVRSAEEKIALANRSLDTMFGDWYRLGGRLDWRVEGLAAGKGEADEKDIARVALFALRNPEYAAYRQKTLPKWIDRTCNLHGVKPEKVIALLPVRKQTEKKDVRKGVTM